MRRGTGAIWVRSAPGPAHLNLFRATAYWESDIMKSIIISGANSKERQLSLSALCCILRKYVPPLGNVLREQKAICLGEKKASEGRRDAPPLPASDPWTGWRGRPAQGTRPRVGSARSLRYLTMCFLFTAVISRPVERGRRLPRALSHRNRASIAPLRWSLWARMN